MRESILVTGASGKLGREVVRQLRASGYYTRVVSRNPERGVSELLGDECLHFDWDKPESYLPVIEGATRVFLTARPLDTNAAEVVPVFLDHCSEAGVQHIVFSSALGADHHHMGPLSLVESHLMNLGVAWTILRPNFFMENFSQGWLAPSIKSEGRINLSAGSGRTSFISVNDVAAVAAKVFSGTTHHGKAYNLTGDDPMSHTAVAAALTKASGRPVNYHEISDEDLRETGRRAGLPGGQLEYFVRLFQMVREGYSAKVYPDVKELLGRDPIGFDEFARANANVWKVNSHSARA